MKLAFDLILHTLFHRVSPSCLIARGGISVTRPDGIALLRPGLPSPARHSNSPLSACFPSVSSFLPNGEGGAPRSPPRWNCPVPAGASPPAPPFKFAYFRLSG